VYELLFTSCPKWQSHSLFYSELQNFHKNHTGVSFLLLVVEVSCKRSSALPINIHMEERITHGMAQQNTQYRLSTKVTVTLYKRFLCILRNILQFTVRKWSLFQKTLISIQNKWTGNYSASHKKGTSSAKQRIKYMDQGSN
jgi:hypothetical protein